MSTDEERAAEFERRTRHVLEESVHGIDARVRSRLTRARFAAVEEAGRVRSGFWPALASSSRGWVPAGALAAGVLIAMLFWTERVGERLPVNAPALEDVELFADAEALELMEEWETGFYEWAASEAENAGASG